MPVMEHGGEVVRDLAQGHGLGQPVWTGTRSWGTMRGGRAVNTSTGNYPATPVAGTPWTNAWSVCVRVRGTSFAGLNNGIVRCGGFVLEEVSGLLKVTNEAGTVIANSTTTLVAGTEYALGARWRSSDNLVSFYVNGVREDVAGVGVATSSVTIAVFASANAVSFVGAVRDIRIWRRYMPDVAFERYYRDPNAFYVSPAVARRGFFFPGVSFSGARRSALMPFLRADRRRG